MRHPALDALDEIERSLGKHMLRAKLSIDPTGSPDGDPASTHMPAGKPSTMKMPGPGHKPLAALDIPSNVNLPKGDQDGDEEYEGQHNPGGHVGHSYGGRHEQRGSENFHFGRKKGG